MNSNLKTKTNFYLELETHFLKNYWKRDNKNIYTSNGFNYLPIFIYKFFADEINRDGKVLDLGCGNGLMLRYLMICSGYKLIPYGVDFMELSIRQAKEILHPQYANHFHVGNVIDYPFFNKPFDFIFADLIIVHPDDVKTYLEKLKKNCKKNGKIVFYKYPNTPNKVLKESDWIEEYPELINWKLSCKNYPYLSLAVWKK